MTDPFLIAHKVRGEPAFDVAIQVECPECHGESCNECDHTGRWWIIPTSGHRAYPYWYEQLDLLDFRNGMHPDWYLKDMPPSLPDHYAHRATPTISLAEALGIKPKPQPSAPIVRRF